MHFKNPVQTFYELFYFSDYNSIGQTTLLSHSNIFVLKKSMSSGSSGSITGITGIYFIAVQYLDDI